MCSLPLADLPDGPLALVLAPLAAAEIAALRVGGPAGSPPEASEVAKARAQTPSTVEPPPDRIEVPAAVSGTGVVLQ